MILRVLRSPRTHIAISFCFALLLLASTSWAQGEAHKPHPLCGNTILGNSAELVSFSPGPTVNHLTARIGDYTPSIPWMSAHDIPEGMGHNLWQWQQLDVCSGDFDGDNDDDLLFVYDVPTASAYIHEIRLLMPALQSEDFDWPSEPAITMGFSSMFGDAVYQSPSTLRVIAGQFNPDDEALEFALGYLAQQGLRSVLEDGDLFGYAMTAISDLDGDGVRELAIGSPSRDDGGTDRGALWIVWFNEDGTIGHESKISDTSGGFEGILENGDNFGGHALASIGDLDGDAVDDLVVSAIRDDDGGTNSGAVYVLLLNADGTVKGHQKISSTEGNFTGPIGANAYWGSGICSLGDLDGNGSQHIAVVGGSDDGGPGRGAVWILDLNTDGTVLDEQKISQTSGGFTGTFQDNQALGLYGGAATIGDLDGDGVPELAVGAAADADGGIGCGAVWVFFLNADGTVKAHQKISPLDGGFTGTLLPGDSFGVGLTAVGDVDGDALPDLLVGAQNTDDGAVDRGAVWILRLNANGTVKSHQKISSTEGGFFGQLDEGDRFGHASAWPGDINGDGENDLVVAAPGDDDGGSDRGAVWTLLLDPSNHDETVASYRKNSMLTNTAAYRLEIYDLQGRVPVPLGGVNGPACPASGFQSDRFDITAGDFDRNGVDDIVMCGVMLVPGSTDHQLFLNIYSPQAGSLVQRAAVETRNTTPTLRWPRASDKSFADIVTRNENGAGIYIDHIALATADLNSSDSVDEIVLAWERRDALWVWDWRVWQVTKEYDFVYWLQTGIVPLSVTTHADPLTPWSISGWERKTQIDSSHDRLFDDESSVAYVPMTGPSLGLATGDLTLTDDGRDEVVVASQDWIRVYRVDEAMSLLPHDVSVPRPGKCFFDPSRRVVSIVDLDAAIDSTVVGSDWRPEVVVQDWTAPGGTKRFRVFRATPDSQTIGSLDLLTSKEETGIIQNFSEVAMAFGDFDGDAVRFGEPAPYQSFTFTQPTVILKSPPVLYDVMYNDALGEEETLDACRCFPPGPPRGYECDDFYAGYTESTLGGVVVEQTSVDDFGASTTLTQSASGKIKFLSAKVERSLTLSVGANFTREGRSEQGVIVTEVQDTKDDGLDAILMSTQQFRAWEYPVYRRDGDGDALKGHYLVVQRQGGPTWDWLNAKTWPASLPYPVESECGNVLSYREYVDPTADPRVAEMWLDDATGRTVKRKEPSFSVESTWLEDHGYKTQWDYGFNVQGSAEVGVELDAFSATTKLEVQASYEHSQINTRRTSFGGGTRFEASFGVLDSTDAHYVIRPYIFRAKSGAIVMDYTAVPVNPQQSWWNTHHYTTDPDPALRLPRGHHEAWDWDLTYPEHGYWSPDITVSTDSARVGETVTLSVKVHNYSLAPLNGTVDVHFYVGDPDGGRWGSDAEGDEILDNVGFQPIVGSQREPFVSTTGGGIPPRGFQTVSMDWVVDEGLPKNSWIYAVIEAPGIDEVHSTLRPPSNNKGYLELTVVGESAVDVALTPPKHANALGQNIPNPFNPVTTIHFTLAQPGFTTLKVYDRAGRLVSTLVNEVLEAGRHSTRWSGHDGRSAQVASGVYFYRLESGSYVETRRMVLLK